MKHTKMRFLTLALITLFYSSSYLYARLGMEYEQTNLSEKAEPVAQGVFSPNWESLSDYECPTWFRDAKFGIWAHWGPQCQPERGDWYARHMYFEDHWAGKEHRKLYGHPSVFGFKDVINSWKAEKWDPQAMMELYKKAGAKYFFAMANHHDNFDNYDSKYQPWNSVNMGPKQDIVGMWARAARDNGLRFGISIHAAHAWSWYEPAQGADKAGPQAGVPYDGNLCADDGKGQWWQGYDPQDLYAQKHKTSSGSDNPGSIHSQWDWSSAAGSSIPDIEYIEKFYNRTIDLINKYQPDELYFDDTVLPLYPISDIGLKIAAHYYNSSIKWHNGENQAVLTGKILNDAQKEALVWDIEKGVPNKIEDKPWQTCTCIGSWHYDRGIFDRHHYKKPAAVVLMLIDIVSKNGNLLLNIPVRGDGSLDSDSVAFLEEFGQWMAVNGQALYGTRPWKIFGEGPAQQAAAELSAQGFNEGKGKPFTQEDIRFVTKDNDLYAFVMAVPTQTVKIRSLALGSQLISKKILSVNVVGSDMPVNFKQTNEALEIVPSDQYPATYAVCYKIVFE